jgi:hypothetical protein
MLIYGYYCQVLKIYIVLCARAVGAQESISEVKRLCFYCGGIFFVAISPPQDVTFTTPDEHVVASLANVTPHVDFVGGRLRSLSRLITTLSLVAPNTGVVRALDVSLAC